ncbi:transcription factor 21 [Salminus brasiliensis]|uniref:transcription factor 21 n=1 Tax=Salminus brasiliensis TaxID=930266 RepID=UPI003B83825E
MSTGSISDADDFHESDLLDGLLRIGAGRSDHGASNESAEESSAGDVGPARACSAKRRKTASSRRADSAAAGAAAAPGHEGKQVQRNAANARERARMRVLSKAFSRLKTTLPWVPADTKLSKLDTLRLAASYIAHLRQILASDKHENGYVHPVNLTWPFMVAGKPDSDLKDMLTSSRLCGTTAS